MFLTNTLLNLPHSKLRMHYIIWKYLGNQMYPGQTVFDFQMIQWFNKAITTFDFQEIFDILGADYMSPNKPASIRVGPFNRVHRASPVIRANKRAAPKHTRASRAGSLHVNPAWLNLIPANWASPVNSCNRSPDVFTLHCMCKIVNIPLFDLSLFPFQSHELDQL